MQDFSSLFSKCYSPRPVFNIYTGQYVLSNCGECPACLLSKSSSLSLKCNIQKNLSKYCYFITLTYNSLCVPKAKIERIIDVSSDSRDQLECDKDDFRFTSIPRPKMSFYRWNYPKSRFYNVRTYKFKDDEISFSFRWDSSKVDSFIKKVNLDVDGKFPDNKGLVSYLNFRDFSLFNKRLRKNLFLKIGRYEKIHSYVCGEYTPNTFRPHFHCLLFFDSPKIAYSIRSAVRASWPFGRVDVQLARDGASSYVAGYVNSYSCVPFIYKCCRSVRPRGYFSNHFAVQFFKERFSRDKKDVDSFQNGVDTVINGRYITVPPFRSVVDTLYPKFADPFASSCEELYGIVRAIATAENRLGFFGFITECSALSFSRRIYYYMHHFRDNLKSLPDWAHVLYNACRLDRYFNISAKECILALYRMIRKYVNFLKYWIDTYPFSPTFRSECLKALDTISYYYVRLDYKNLTNSLAIASEYFSCHQYTDDAYLLFVPNSVDSRENLARYQLYRSESLDFQRVLSKFSFRMSKAIKHKELNDKNLMYTY